MIHIIKEKHCISATGHAAKTKDKQTKDAIAACSGVTILMETLAHAFDQMGDQWRTGEQMKGKMVIYTQNATAAGLILIEAIAGGLRGMAEMYPNYVDYQEIS